HTNTHPVIHTYPVTHTNTSNSHKHTSSNSHKHTSSISHKHTQYLTQTHTQYLTQTHIQCLTQTHNLFSHPSDLSGAGCGPLSLIGLKKPLLGRHEVTAWL